MLRYDGTGPTWHVSLNKYSVGTVLGGHEPSHFWIEAMAHPAKKAVEELLDAHRPRTAPSRRTAVFITDRVPLVQRFARRPGARIYVGVVPPSRLHWGRLDMGFLDYMTSRGATEALARGYWEGEPCPTTLDAWEILTEAYETIGEVPADRVARFVATKSWQDADPALITL
jgi:hypothetical protein